MLILPRHRGACARCRGMKDAVTAGQNLSWAQGIAAVAGGHSKQRGADMLKDESKQMKKALAWVMSVFIVLVMGAVIFLNVKNTRELTKITRESIESQLISVSVAALEILDIDALDGYNSLADVENDQAKYDATLEKLRQLARNVGAEYIYVLKQIGNEYYFVFDTDTEDEEIFIPYELSRVHMDAFAGTPSADIMNVDDDYGSFNTGAIPIWKNGNVIAIVSADIRDTYLERSTSAARTNTIILVVTLVVVLGAMVAAVLWLAKRVRQMQAKLEHMAHIDTITGLPNRQYLFEYLGQLEEVDKKAPFAVFFIDLDNFKQVNDNAGHDAGDELLQRIAKFLEREAKAEGGDIKTFHPTAGLLNVSARVGGDEFIQIVHGVESPETAGQLAQRLLDNFAQQQDFDRFIKKYQVGLSVGIALYPYHSDNYHVLIKYADIAMYNAKKAGKNQYRVYTEEMHAKED